MPRKQFAKRNIMYYTMMYMSTFVSKQRKDEKNNVCIKIMDSLKKKKLRRSFIVTEKEALYFQTKRTEQTIPPQLKLTSLLRSYTGAHTPHIACMAGNVTACKDCITSRYQHREKNSIIPVSRILCTRLTLKRCLERKLTCLLETSISYDSVNII